MIRERIIVSTPWNNSYLYSPRLTQQILFLHPLLVKLLSEIDDNSIQNGSIDKQKTLTENLQFFSKEEIEYYYDKMLFLWSNGLLGPIKTKIKPVTPALIQSKIEKLTYLAFNITETCNLNCEYCGIGDFYLGNNNRKNKQPNIEFGLKIVDFFLNKKKNSFEEFTINFNGGEPLINLKFIKEIVLHNKKTWPLQSIRYQMITNAILLDKHMDFLVENNFDITISIDGNKEHSKFRTKKNGENSFSVFYENIKKMKAKYPDYFRDNVGFYSVSLPKNTEQVKDFLFNEFGKKTVISLAIPDNIVPHKKDEFFHKFYEIGAKTWSKNTINSSVEKIGNEFIFNNYVDLLNAEYLKPIEECKHFPYYSKTCVPFSDRIYISAHGDILHCEVVPDEAAFGKIIDSGNEITIETEIISEKTNKLRTVVDKICGNCYNVDCKKCMPMNNPDENYICDLHIDQNEFKRILSQHISNLENCAININ